MNFLYVFTNDILNFSEFQICIQNEPLSIDKKIIFCIPVADKSILERLEIKENENIKIDNFSNWKLWIKRLIDHLDQNEIKKDQQSFMETSLENIKISVVEENTKLNEMLNKINNFRSNVKKIQNNLDSIKKIKLVTPVIPSERLTIRSELFSLDDCKKWIENKSMNPKTNRKIDLDGPTYKKIEMMSKIYGLLK
jgi:hypothetical protein